MLHILSNIIKPITGTIRAITGNKEKRENYQYNLDLKQLEHKTKNFGTFIYQATLLPFITYFYIKTILFFTEWIINQKQPAEPLFSDTILLTILGSILGISSLGKLVKNTKIKQIIHHREDQKEKESLDFPEEAIEQLKKHEGLRLKVYKDTVGIETIGYGRNLKDRGITDNEAQYLLNNDIEDHRQRLLEKKPWIREIPNLPRRWVLYNMAFNLGVNGLLQFKNTLSLIKKEQYKQASKSMLQSKWAKQVGSRATTLAQQMKTGEWK